MSERKSSHFINNVGGVIPVAASLAGPGQAPKRKILEFLSERYPFQSVADLGCGSAGWLEMARRLGVARVHGYDLPEIDIAERAIRPEEFTAADLTAPLDFPEPFDLAISTEVCEHIPEPEVGRFMDNLTAAAPVVLFSGALPYQGGLGHVNEQWVEYWHGFFVERDFHCIDCFREHFWHDPAIPYYYRQNLFLYVRSDQLPAFRDRGLRESPNPLSYIHPDMYLKLIHNLESGQLAARHSLRADVETYYAAARERADGVRYQGYGTDSFSDVRGGGSLWERVWLWVSGKG